MLRFARNDGWILFSFRRGAPTCRGMAGSLENLARGLGPAPTKDENAKDLAGTMRRRDHRRPAKTILPITP